MKRFLSVLLTLSLLLSAAPALGEEVILTDQAGREVTLTGEANRVVSCYYMSTAALLALGCEDRLVGIEEKAASRNLYCAAAPEIIDLPAVGSGKGVNEEAILALEPDLVILPLKLKDAADRLQELGLTALVVNPESGELLEECLLLLGQATGSAEKAQALLEKYAAITDEVSALTADLYKPAVYMTSQSSALSTYPRGMYQHGLMDTAGGRNVAGEIAGSAKITVDPEQLLAWDPEYIFVVAGAGENAEDILKNEQFSPLSAVRLCQVISMPDGIEAWDYPTLSSVLGVLFMASAMHPEVLPHTVMAEKAVQFYEEVFGFTPAVTDLGFPEGWLE